MKSLRMGQFGRIGGSKNPAFSLVTKTVECVLRHSKRTFVIAGPRLDRACMPRFVRGRSMGDHRYRRTHAWQLRLHGIFCTGRPKEGRHSLHAFHVKKTGCHGRFFNNSPVKDLLQHQVGPGAATCPKPTAGLLWRLLTAAARPAYKSGHRVAHFSSSCSTAAFP